MEGGFLDSFILGHPEAVKIGRPSGHEVFLEESLEEGVVLAISHSRS